MCICIRTCSFILTFETRSFLSFLIMVVLPYFSPWLCSVWQWYRVSLLHEATRHLCRSCALDDDRRWRSLAVHHVRERHEISPLMAVEVKLNFMHLLSSSPNNALFLSTSFFVGSRLTHQQNVQSILLFD